MRHRLSHIFIYSFNEIVNRVLAVCICNSELSWLREKLRGLRVGTWRRTAAGTSRGDLENAKGSCHLAWRISATTSVQLRGLLVGTWRTPREAASWLWGHRLLLLGRCKTAIRLQILRCDVFIYYTIPNIRRPFSFFSIICGPHLNLPVSSHPSLFSNL